MDHRHGTALSESQLATDCDRLHNACHKHRKKHLRQRKAPLRLLQRLQRRPDGIRAQYAVETFPGKTAAHNADCFTTVSDITARECEQLLEIKPLVTPNGFELSIVPERQKYTAQRKKARAKLLQVAEALTGKHYDDDTFLYATAGRNEFRNKGLDMFIDATNALRNGHDMNRQTIAFILVPAWENGAREDLKSRLEKGETQGALEDCIITHRLHDYSSDAIYNKLEYLGMHNSADSKVDTIYVPCYLNGSDGIFNMQYYDLLIGFDAAVLHPTTSLGDTLPTKAWRSEYPQSLPTLQASGNGFCPHSEEASASAASRLPTGQTRTTKWQSTTLPRNSNIC